MNLHNDSQSLEDFARLTLDRLIAYRNDSMDGSDKVIDLKPFNELEKDLVLDQFVNQLPISQHEFKRFLNLYLQNSMHIHNPKNIGHQLSPSKFPSVVADIMISAMNNGSGLYEMGPSASVIERWVIDWMLKRIGWYSKGSCDPGGVLCSGGTMANITALAAARNNAAPSLWKEGCHEPLVILTSAESHFSIARAAGILGIGADNVISVASDSNGKLIVDELRSDILKQLDYGNKIVAVVANACTTSSGVYDRLTDIAEVCDEFNIWMHVDGAHGASAIITDKFRYLLNGIELADSVTWDAHKMLQTTSVCAGALFKRRSDIDTAFTGFAPYLSLNDDYDYPNQMRRTIECTKPALGLKLYLTLALLGEAAVAGYIENMYQTTTEFYNIIESKNGFECLCKPESNILCFRIIGRSTDEQKAVRKKLLEDGNFYITETKVNGEYYFRLSVMNETTSLSDINSLLDYIANYHAFGGEDDFLD